MGKNICPRKGAERSGFSNGMGGVTGATKAADTGLGDPLIGSPGCTSVPNPISIGDYHGFRVYQTRTEAVPSRTAPMVD